MGDGHTKSITLVSLFDYETDDSFAQQMWRFFFNFLFKIVYSFCIYYMLVIILDVFPYVIWLL